MNTPARRRRNIQLWDPLTFLIVLYLIIRPVGFNQILLPVLALWAGWSCIRLAKLRNIPRSTWALFIPLIAFGLLWTAYGRIVNNPGWQSGFLVWVVAPVVYGLVAAASSFVSVEAVYRAIVLGTLLVSTAILMMWARVGIDIVQLVDPPSSATSGSRVTGSGLSAEVRFVGLQSLVAAVPIVICRGFFAKRGWTRNTTLAIGLFGFVAMALSGRRGGIAAHLVCLAVLVIWAQRRTIGEGLRHFRVPLAYFAGMTLLGTVILNTAVLGPVANGFNAAPSLLGITLESEIERSSQAAGLIRAWSMKPVHGWGFGAVYPIEVLRSEERPWNFELQYHLLLAQTGVIGVFILFRIWKGTVASWIGLVRSRADLMLPAIAGWIAIVVANASNPYLVAPGNMWSLYLPAMVFAAHERERQPRGRTRGGDSIRPFAEGPLIPSTQAGNNFR